MLCLNATIELFCYRFIRYFDVCIIDEASQCTEPWSLVALQYQIKSLVLVGDTNQLSPVVLSPVGSFLYKFFYFFDIFIFNIFFVMPIGMPRNEFRAITFPSPI